MFQVVYVGGDDDSARRGYPDVVGAGGFCATPEVDPHPGITRVQRAFGDLRRRLYDEGAANERKDAEDPRLVPGEKFVRGDVGSGVRRAGSTSQHVDSHFHLEGPERDGGIA